MIQVGIIGGAGYTAGELIRLLLDHPDVELCWVHSSSNAGKKVTEIHKGLFGETDLVFTDKYDFDCINMLFFCTPHGESRNFMQEHAEEMPKDLKIIDLSNDFRLYDGKHDFVYGLPELNRKKMVRGAIHVANPGCFATAIQLALLPLAKNLLLHSDIHITAITGRTGAGVKPSATTHYSWRNDNVSIYKPFRHQHLDEIRQTVTELQNGFNSEILFVPMRGCFSRGILASIYLDCNLSIEEVTHLYEEYYSDHSFTFISSAPVDLKDVVNTNKCLIHLEKIDGKLLITSVIENLVKGASGTAVKNLNLLFVLS